MMRKHLFQFVLSAAILMTALNAEAETFQPPKNPALEARYFELAEELRCLVCQNQSLADSHAALAVDLKNAVSEQLIAGRSNDEIRTYMTDRYGDFVTYRPPVDKDTLLLWFTPLIVLLISAFFLIRRYVRQSDTTLQATIDAAETDKDLNLDDMLNDKGSSAGNSNDSQ